MTKFDAAYKEILSKIYNFGVEELNERTGLRTKIVTGAHFDINVNDFPILTLRKIPIKLFTTEQIWYLQGTKNLTFFQKFSSAWDAFKEDDNTVSSGYGYRWRKYFDRDQIEGLVEMLAKEPSSRQGVVVTWDPNKDGLDSPKQKNVPCVPMWVANIVDGKLNFHVIFRSSDVILGFPHDVAGFALLLHILAQKLGVNPGMLHFSVSHIHIYENHYEAAREILNRDHDHDEIKLVLPENTYQKAVDENEEVVLEIYKNLKKQYKPLESLGKLPIAI